MCDPMTIAGIALSGASMAAKSVGDSQIQRARSDAMTAERVRQQGLQQEATALNEGSRARYDNFSGQQGEKSKQIGDYFSQQTAPLPSAGAPMTDAPASSSNITVQEQARQGEKASAYSGQQAAARGNLRSFGDLLGGIGRLQGEDALKIGQIGGFEQGSAGVLPYELEAANGAGGNARLLGDVLGGLGKIGMTAGLSGGGIPGLGSGAGGSLPTMAQGGMGPDMPSGFGLPTFAQGMPKSPGLSLGSMLFGAAPSTTRAPAFRGLY
jgi:hypothetical protein